MNNYINRAELNVSPLMINFIESEVLPGLAISAPAFWQSFANVVHDLQPQNMALLAERDALQEKLDQWNADNSKNFDALKYKAFLEEIGYLVEEGDDFQIGTENVDDEIALQAGPQLVVPTSNARFALNATNSRWGSLYDAVYGTDVISEDNGAHRSGPYNQVRGDKVIEFGRALLDAHFPLSGASHRDASAYTIVSGELLVTVNDRQISLLDSDQCVAYQGESSAPTSVLLKHNGLHIAIEIDAQSEIGKTDTAGVKDLTVESAITTIQDFEDSVAAVDAEDKVAVYRNWLGLMKGDLSETFNKGGRQLTRILQADKTYTKLDGAPLTIHGRSLLFCRNVGHLMSNPAVLDRDGNEVQEGIMDAMISILIAKHDLARNDEFVNSRAGSIYIVKPKMHGPKEVAFANTLFNRVEDELGLSRHTVKIGVMDEERRTTVNLKECIRAVKDRVVFINTGFLDRTGDEIHTSMLLGAMAPKAEIKKRPWISAYEDWNVDIGLECGLSGKAQIGKGMWAMPNEMADMLVQKSGHPKAGANTAWVPSPNGAILHATHYHEVDVFAIHDELKARARASLDDILSIPLCFEPQSMTAEQIQSELDNNAQGILGYVVRWIDQGVGCSTVPDINNIGLMEDRATLRISSQLIANWLTHGLTNEAQIRSTFERMAAIVDEQNSADSKYKKMDGNFDTSLAYQAALALCLQGKEQPNGYTEPLLHEYRLRLKATS